MSTGLILTWFILTALSFIYLVIDIRHTPEASVLKWAWVILIIFTGPVGAFFYVLGCREPLPGMHEAYVSARWRQVLGSTMHCAAGDGVGIIAGAAISAVILLSGWVALTLEYALGFGFGWAFFQAFAMRDMAGGSYIRSLKMTFYPEFVSMNVLMGGMIVIMSALMSRIAGARDPMRLEFWFVMSMSLLVGFILAYPVNWWMVANGLKHGMFTVRKKEESMPKAHDIMQNRGVEHTKHGAATQKVSMFMKLGMLIFTIIFFATCIIISRSLAS